MSQRVEYHEIDRLTTVGMVLLQVRFDAWLSKVDV